MQCPRCYGKGRIVQQVTYWIAGDASHEVPEISPCPVCHGACVIHCCEGDREQAMLSASSIGECNPNGEAS
jgi:hypothetical protein